VLYAAICRLFNVVTLTSALCQRTTIFLSWLFTVHCTKYSTVPVPVECTIMVQYCSSKQITVLYNTTAELVQKVAYDVQNDLLISYSVLRTILDTTYPAKWHSWPTVTNYCQLSACHIDSPPPTFNVDVMFTRRNTSSPRRIFSQTKSIIMRRSYPTLPCVTDYYVEMGVRDA